MSFEQFSLFFGISVIYSFLTVKYFYANHQITVITLIRFYQSINSLPSVCVAYKTNWFGFIHYLTETGIFV